MVKSIRTHEAQNSRSKTFLSLHPDLSPRIQMNDPWSIQSRLTRLPTSGLTHPGRRKGGGPFLICASRTSQDGSFFFARRVLRTAGSWRAVKSAVEMGDIRKRKSYHKGCTYQRLHSIWLCCGGWLLMLLTGDQKSHMHAYLDPTYPRICLEGASILVSESHPRQRPRRESLVQKPP